jgi:hypothetical protein
MCGGVLSGVVYDVFYVIRCLVCGVIFAEYSVWDKLFCGFLDILWFVCLALFYIFLSVLFSFSYFQIAPFLGIWLGFIIYLKSIHVLIAFFSRKVYNKLSYKRRLAHEKRKAQKGRKDYDGRKAQQDRCRLHRKRHSASCGAVRRNDLSVRHHRKLKQQTRKYPKTNY